MTTKLQDSLAAARKVMQDTSPYRDMKRVEDIRRDYMIQLRAVTLVDDHFQTCGLCGTDEIRCNIYATLLNGDQEMWTSCDDCTFASIDEIEDVDPQYIVIIERA